MCVGILARQRIITEPAARKIAGKTVCVALPPRSIRGVLSAFRCAWCPASNRAVYCARAVPLSSPLCSAPAPPAAMFVLMVLKDTLRIPPSELTPKIKYAIQDHINQKYANKVRSRNHRGAESQRKATERTMRRTGRES